MRPNHTLRMSVSVIAMHTLIEASSSCRQIPLSLPTKADHAPSSTVPAAAARITSSGMCTMRRASRENTSRSCT